MFGGEYVFGGEYPISPLAVRNTGEISCNTIIIGPLKSP